MPRCSLAASNLGSSSGHLFVASRCEPFDMFEHFSGQNFASLVVTCFFVSRP